MGMTGGRGLPVPVRSADAAARRSRAPASLRPLERAPSLTDAVAGRVRGMIVDGTLAPGAALTEASLADILRVSKTPVREALAQLKAEGLVTIAPHRGTFVFQASPDEIEPICAHWATLAVAALRAAAVNDPDGVATALRGGRERLSAARDAMDAAAFARAEADLHAALFACCGNPFLADAHRLIAAKILAIRIAAPEPAAALPAADAELHALTADLTAGRIDAASARLEARIRAIARQLGVSLAAPAKAPIGHFGAMLLGWEAFTEESLLLVLDEMPTLMALLPKAMLLN